MTDCPACDGLGHCPTCQGRKCADCLFIGDCHVCKGGQLYEAQRIADRTGRTQVVINAGSAYTIIEADTFAPQDSGRGYRPNLCWVAWPDYWRYQRGAS